MLGALENDIFICPVKRGDCDHDIPEASAKSDIAKFNKLT